MDAMDNSLLLQENSWTRMDETWTRMDETPWTRQNNPMIRACYMDMDELFPEIWGLLLGWLRADIRWEALVLDGYRCFARAERLELRPLTLLYGRNNAGKSAALRALTVVARSVAESAQGPWDMGDEDGPGLGASFLGLPWRGSPGRRFSFELEWSLAGESCVDRFTLEQDGDLTPPYVREVHPSRTSKMSPWWKRVATDDPLSRQYRCRDGIHGAHVPDHQILPERLHLGGHLGSVGSVGHGVGVALWRWTARAWRFGRPLGHARSTTASDILPAVELAELARRDPPTFAPLARLPAQSLAAVFIGRECH